jgi:hypothetical protein
MSTDPNASKTNPETETSDKPRTYTAKQVADHKRNLRLTIAGQAVALLVVALWPAQLLLWWLYSSILNAAGLSHCNTITNNHGSVTTAQCIEHAYQRTSQWHFLIWCAVICAVAFIVLQWFDQTSSDKILVTPTDLYRFMRLIDQPAWYLLVACSVLTVIGLAAGVFITVLPSYGS